MSYTYTTYNIQITPATAITLNTYYWRVSGVDAGDHVGAASASRTFTLNAPLVATDPAPLLLTPADGETITVDPNFSWTRVAGAADYHLIVSTQPDFSPSYDYGYTDYASFTPYTSGISGYRNAYPNGTYYWKVDARNGSGTVIATSAAHSFIKQMTLPLIAPGDVATLTTDPTFQWTRVVGAHDYHLIVSTQSDFSPSYDYGYSDYVSFTPYTSGVSGYRNAYPNGTYYWKIEARDHGGTVIVTSAARSFTKQMTLPLITPADGATLTTDPTFQWTRVVGAHDYHLIVSKAADFNPSYDYGYSDYVSFTPYTYGVSGYKNAYTNGTYYWKIEARDHGGTVIVTSTTRSFTKQMTLPLITPANGARLTTDPTFQWTRVVGAHDYRLLVSKDPSFSPLYDYVYTDYVSFTPYTAGQKTAYLNGTYYWKVEARDHGGTVIVTSDSWTVTISRGNSFYVPIIIR
jgi:hypothetical protein